MKTKEESPEPVPEEVEFPVEEEVQVKEQEYVKWQKCDKKCPAEARVTFISPDGERDIVFCGHHAEANREALALQGFFELVEPEKVDEEPQEFVEETIDSTDDSVVE